jgi:spore coat polysaccharide biosynthesis protein SpsF
MTNLMVIIQARMTSTRLPGKVLMPLCSSSVLEVMIERLKPLKNHIIVATTNDGSERPILELCNRLNIKSYQGDTEDVLSRYFEAAEVFGAEKNTTVVRLTSDCPLIDVQLCQKVIEKHQTGHFDMVNLGPHSGYPRGLDCCAFSFSLLANTHRLASHPADREHVTLGMAKFSDISVFTYSAKQDLSHYRLTLDESDDYTAIKAIYNAFSNDLNFNYAELIKKLKQNPKLADINKHVEQKPV